MRQMSRFRIAVYDGLRNFQSHTEKLEQGLHTHMNTMYTNQKRQNSAPWFEMST